MWVHRASRATTPRDAGTRPSVGQIGFSRALRPSADAPHRPSCRAYSKSQSVPSNRFHQGKTCSGAAHTPSLTAGLGHVCLMCSLFALFLLSFCSLFALSGYGPFRPLRRPIAAYPRGSRHPGAWRLGLVSSLRAGAAPRRRLADPPPGRRVSGSGSQASPAVPALRTARRRCPTGLAATRSYYIS